MTDEKTCKNCKWWSVNFEGDCSFVKTVHVIHKPTQFEVIGIARDDQGLEWFLRTGPDFGCIHFEQKV